MGVYVVFFCGLAPAKNTTYTLPPKDFPKTQISLDPENWLEKYNFDIMDQLYLIE
jgi:hypothetical protein